MSEYDDPALVAAILEAVTPTPADLVIGREVVLHTLKESGEAASFETLRQAFLCDTGGPIPEAPRTTHLERRADEPGRLAPPRPDEPAIRRMRADRVIAQTLAELISQGVVIYAAGDIYNVPRETLSVSHAGGAGGVQIPAGGPVLPKSVGRVQLLDASAQSERVLTTDQMLDGLRDLLGVRGERAVRESRAALSRGLFLAGASLLASASEAAWFSVGRSVSQPSSSLRNCLESGQNVGTVIQQVCEHLTSTKSLPGMAVNELRADGYRFRDIRNYALHPVEAHDEDREAWLTATGATVLMLSARRYLVRMAQAKAILNSARTPNTSPH